MAKKNNKRAIRKKLTEIGETAPSNFKFAVIVAVAIFWAEFLKTLLELFIGTIPVWTGPAIRDFIIAVIATAIAFVVLVFYRKIKNKIAKVKVPV
jgi:hypothetical protein